MSRYRRFHGGVSELSPELLKRLTTIDRRHEIALIATTSSFGREVGVGEARYSNEDADPDSREFAIVVADAWQGRGLGSKLLQRLISHAQSRNVRRLYGNVLAENASMLGLAREQGFALRHHPRDSHLVRVRCQRIHQGSSLAALRVELPLTLVAALHRVAMKLRSPR
jgi:acetyltransferase